MKKMKKKVLGILLAVVFCLALIPAVVFAADAQADDNITLPPPEKITPDYSWYSADKTEYEISSVHQLAALGKLTQGNVTVDGVTLTKTNFAGKTVKLGADVAFADNQYWYYNDGTTTYNYIIKDFAGAFDGNNHTVSNMSYNKSSGSQTLTLFEKIAAGGSIKNLIIDTVNVDTAGGTFCTVTASLAGEAVNCHVKNITVNSTIAVTISGFASLSGTTASADQCTVDGLNATMTGDVSYGLQGGGFGTCNGTVTNCDVKNVTAISYGELKFNSFGSINGTLKSCNVDNITLVTKGSKQIKELSGFGAVAASAYVEDCHVNTLNIKVEGTGHLQKVGGFTYAGRGTFKGCTVNDFTVITKGSVQQIGGFVNEAYGDSSYENCSVNNFKLELGDETNPKTLTCIGGFIGQSRNGALTVTNCHVTGLQMDLNSTIGADTPGGFIAQAAGDTTFTNCSVDGYINATYDNPNNRPVGGFAGNFGWGSGSTCTFTGCEANVDITAVGPAGGFMGQVKPQGSSSTTNVTFTECVANGNVTSTNSTAGGFASIGDSGTFINCAVNGDVSGATATGGFVGELISNKNGDENITLNGCDANGSVDGNDGIAGGLVGYVQPDVTTTFDDDCTPATVLNGSHTSEVANSSDKLYTQNNGGSITIETPPDYLCYGKIGGFDIGYETIQEALDAGATAVTLIKNAAEDVTLKTAESSTVTFDLGAYTLDGHIYATMDTAITIKGTSTGNSIVLDNEYKTRKNFYGYFTDGAYTAASRLADNTVTEATADGITYYAKWLDPIVLSGTVDAQDLLVGTEDTPVVYLVEGIVIVNGRLNIPSGSVIIYGDPTDGADMLKRNVNDTAVLNVPFGASLTVEYITLDGGAVWSGAVDNVLNRGTVNIGISGGNLITYEGAVTVNGCVLQNHDGSQFFSSNYEYNSPESVLNVNKSVVINNNGGISWSRDIVNFTDTELAYNSGTPSVFRPCTSSVYTASGCDIHHNKGEDFGVIYSYNATVSLINGTQIHHNVATDDVPSNDGSQSGYIIYFNGGRSYTIAIKDSSITNNTAVTTGGIHQSTANITFENAVIADNTHTGTAGGDNLYIEHGWYTFKVGGAGNRVYWSGTYPTFTKLTDDASLAGVTEQFHHEGTVADDCIFITYINADSTAVSFISLNPNGGVLEPTGAGTSTVLPEPEKENYSFVGWFENNGGDSTDDADWGEQVTVVNSNDGTYYARWIKSQYNDYTEEERTLDFATSTYGDALPSSKTFEFIYQGLDTPSILSVDASAYFDVSFSGLILTVTPKAGLDAGVYEEHITVLCHDDSTHTIILKFVVEPKEIVIDWVSADFTYNGNDQSSGITATYTDINGATVELTVTFSALFKNAGEHTATAVFANGETNYKLPADPTKLYTIDKAQIEIPTADISTFTYTGGELTYYVQANANYSVIGNVQINAGSHTVTVRIDDKDNYEWSNGSTDDVTFGFEIAKADPVFSWPIGLSGVGGKTLSSVALPHGFSWNDGTQVLDCYGGQYEITYTPDDTSNYNAVQGQVNVVSTHNYGWLITRVEPTCSATGVEAHYFCDVCDTYFTAEKAATTYEALIMPIDHNAHSFGAVSYVWAADNSSCTASRVCQLGCGHSETEAAVIDRRITQAQSCTNPELTTYTASFTNAAFNTQIKANLMTASALGHEYGELIAKVDATCVATGFGAHYFCDVCDTYFTSSKHETTYNALILAVDPAAHSYGSAVYSWAADHTSCQAMRICGYDSSHIDYANATVTSTVTHPKTCTADEYSRIIATFDNPAFETQIKENVKTGDKLGHTYGELIARVEPTCSATGFEAHYFCDACDTYFIAEKVETTAAALVIAVDPDAHKFGAPYYVWSNENTVCTATRVCEHNGEHTDTENAAIQAEVTQAKSCTTDELTKYTATFTNPAFEAQIKGNVMTGSALGHEYGELIAKVDATCSATGFGAHYFCDVCDTYFTAEKFETTAVALVIAIDANAHSYGAPTYVWAADNSSCTATRVCAHNGEHTESESATATAVITQNKSCTDDELTKCTVNFTNSAFSAQIKENVKTGDKLGHEYGELIPRVDATCSATGFEAHYFCDVCDTYFISEGFETIELALIIPIDADAHKYGAPTYVWAADNTTCTATRVCAHDGAHKDTEAATVVKTVLQELSCTEDEICSFNATFKSAVFAAQAKENVTTADALGHEYGELIERVDASCSAAGFEAHYLCSECNVIFNEEKAEVTEEDMTIAIVEDAHSYNVSKSNIFSHWKRCDHCDETKDQANHKFVNGVCDCGYKQTTIMLAIVLSGEMFVLLAMAVIFIFKRRY